MNDIPRVFFPLGCVASALQILYSNRARSLSSSCASSHSTPFCSSSSLFLVQSNRVILAWRMLMAFSHVSLPFPISTRNPPMNSFPLDFSPHFDGRFCTEKSVSLYISSRYRIAAPALMYMSPVPASARVFSSPGSFFS